MLVARTKIGLLARAWTLLVLTAFLARAVVPQGYMPEVDGQSGKLTVTMCTADSAHGTVTIDFPLDKPVEKQADKDCPYALNHAANLPPHSAKLQAAEAYVFATRLFGTAQWPIEEAWPAHAPPTGPPSLI